MQTHALFVNATPGGALPSSTASLAAGFHAAYNIDPASVVAHIKGADNVYLAMMPNFIVPGGSDIFFLPQIPAERFLLIDYKYEDARTRIADLANKMGIKGSVARVAFGETGKTALDLEVYHYDKRQLQSFKGEICHNGPSDPPATIEQLREATGALALHERRFIIHSGGPEREDGQRSAGSVNSYSLRSPTAFHFSSIYS